METLDYINLTPEETGKLLSAGSGEAALLYLYMKSTGDHTLRHAAEYLHIPSETLGWAESLLKRLGLMEIRVAPTRFQKEKAPVYTSAAIQEYARKDDSFKLLQGEVSRRLGRVLTTEELKILLSIRDYLKLPPEVVSMALTHCLQKLEYYNASHGSDRTLSMRALEKECYEWANHGVTTMEAASQYISRELQRLAPESQVKKALGIDRPLVDSEQQYIKAWLDMGFPTDSIRLAYEKTIENTGKLAWRYLNKILLNWHGKNLHTLSEIQGGEDKAKPQVQQTFTPGDQERAAIERLRKLRESVKE